MGSILKTSTIESSIIKPLIRTPGHIVENHSFVAHTLERLKVTNQNGVGLESL